MSLTVAIANPLEHAFEVKEFFVVNGLATFPDFFDRTYPAAVERGATVWLGRDERGRLVMYQACFPRRFRHGGRDLVAGLMVNMMVARDHRSFFPALGLMRRVLQDLGARGDVDFLYADPNETARRLLQVAGFVELGTLQRYVLPIAGRGVADWGVRLFHAVLRATDGAGAGMAATSQAASEFAWQSVAAPPSGAPYVTAYHDPALYASRLPGYPSALDWWLTLRRSAAPGPPDGAWLVRGPDAAGLAALRAVRCRPDVGPAAALPALIAELRRRGCTRLQVSTIAESRLGRALRRAGFRPRQDRVPMLAKALSPAGEACIRAVADWEITDLECDR